MNIKILGSGCASCQALERMVRQALKEMGLDVPIDKVTEVEDIMSYGIMWTPGLVIDGEVKASGRLPKMDELKRLLSAGATK